MGIRMPLIITMKNRLQRLSMFDEKRICVILFLRPKARDLAGLTGGNLCNQVLLPH